MEVSVIGTSQINLGKSDDSLRELGFFTSGNTCQFLFPKTRVCFAHSKSFLNTTTTTTTSRCGFAIRAVQADSLHAVEDSSTKIKSVSFWWIYFFVF